MKLRDKIGLWWYDNIYFPLWYRFGSKASHDEVKRSLKKRRENGGCSMWRGYLKEHPESAKHDWEKEFVKEINK